MARRILVLLTMLAVWTSIPSVARGSDVVTEPVVSGLDFATNLAFAPDGTGFLTEKDLGQILVLRDGRLLDEPFATLPVLVTVNETGLLGVAVHPAFPDEPWVYAYYTDRDTGTSRVVRIRAEGDVGTDVEPILELAEVTGFHNGGDMTFGPDGRLYVVTGETQQPDRSQDPADVAGKILRVEPDGSIPDDNPTTGSPVYALGIRNSFGLCFDTESGGLWETENGPDRYDEINRIEAGGNYGWPTHLGPAGAAGFEDPVMAFEEPIVPTGCAVDAGGGGLYVGTYGGDLHRIVFPGMGADDRSPRDEIVARFDQPVIDVVQAPLGRLYVVAEHALYRTLTQDETGTDTSPSTSVSPSPSPGSEGLSPATIVIGLILIAAFLLFRTRMGRADR